MRLRRGVPASMQADVNVDERFLSQTNAEKYAAYTGTPEGRLRFELSFANLQEILPRFDSSRPLRALDLGCGPGAASLSLAGMGFQVTMLDSSPAMLEIAKRAVEKAGVTAKVALEQGEAADIANLLPKGTFDLVLCHNILEHVEDPAAVVSAVSRVVRNESTRPGIVSILVRNRAGEVFKAGIQQGNLGMAERYLTDVFAQESLFGGQVRLFTRDSLRAMLAGTPLELIAERGVRVISDYLPLTISRDGEYQKIFELERKLGSQPEFAAVARYTQYFARRSESRIENKV